MQTDADFEDILLFKEKALLKPVISVYYGFVQLFCLLIKIRHFELSAPRYGKYKTRYQRPVPEQNGPV